MRLLKAWSVALYGCEVGTADCGHKGTGGVRDALLQKGCRLGSERAPYTTGPTYSILHEMKTNFFVSTVRKQKLQNFCYVTIRAKILASTS